MMRVTEYVRDRIRQRGELLPPGFSWSFAVRFDSAVLLVLIGSTLQRTRADLLPTAVAALVAISPFALFFAWGSSTAPDWSG